ncbi:MAG: hypothetical protein IH965_10210 [Gemmatimonadetes bacterium]|nr:hypothetical protein [Gemmatimonadota bacterium]
MSSSNRSFRILLTLAVLAVVSAAPAAAQGRGNNARARRAAPRVSIDLAVSAAREVLVAQGFEVVRVETKDDYKIVYYRRGNRGRGRGFGPPARMIIRRVEDRIVLDEAPEGIRLEISVKLGIRL